MRVDGLRPLVKRGSHTSGPAANTFMKCGSSPWVIVGFLFIGWAPLCMADFMNTRPWLSTSNQPVEFAVKWMLVTLLCSVTAAVALLVHAIVFVARWCLRDDLGWQRKAILFCTIEPLLRTLRLSTLDARTVDHSGWIRRLASVGLLSRRRPAPAFGARSLCHSHAAVSPIGHVLRERSIG
jgi:hypothetical protein